MNLTVRFAVAGLVLAGSLQAAHASTVDAAALLRDYNLITAGDATVSSHVDGKSLIGGNLAGGGDFNIHSVSSTAPALTVAGNVTSGSFNVNGKNLHVGGALSGSVTMNGGGNGYVGSVSGSLMNNANGTGSTYVVGNIAGSVHTNSGSTVYGGTLTGSATANGSGSVKHEPVTRPFDPATVASDAIKSLTAYSSQLNGIAKNSDYSTDGGTVTFTASGTGLTSFEITDADSFFSNAGQFQFNLNNQQTILINVRGADAALNLHANFLAGAAPNWGKRILWNFIDAKSINVNSQFGGSILALFADVTVDQNLEGTLVANRLLRQSAEIHSQPLDPSYPAAVPLPAAAPLFGAALAGLGAFARRGRQLTA